jgi:hypothetical protein
LITLFLEFYDSLIFARIKGKEKMGQLYRMCAAQAVAVGVDYEVIENLKRSVGEVRYEEFAELSAFKLADRLGQLERALREVDLTMCYRHALNICGVSSQIGLVDVSKVASDVMKCSVAGNIDALTAVIGRLNRVAEASLFSVFELGA